MPTGPKAPVNQFGHSRTYPDASSRNGWISDTDVGYKDSRWRQRAFYGLKGVLAPGPSRSHTGANCLKDPEGRPLSGEHHYTITFDLNDMPPVTEFWEMPLYDLERKDSVSPPVSTAPTRP